MSDAFADVLPATEEQDDANEWLIALAVVLLLLGANAHRPLSLAQRRRARNLLRNRFEVAALVAAQGWANGTLSADAWRAQVEQAITDYARQMTVAGAGAMPDAALRRAARGRIAEQMPFLERFTAAVATGTMSVNAITARTRLYGGTGWGMFWQAQGQGAADGVVEQWIARDDRFTCRVCAPRNGQYFLPGQPPFPGTDCLGRGACRCERRQVVDFEIWQQLTGRRAA